MKKILFAAIGIALSLSFTGCYDLNRAPYDKVSSASFWKTEAHVNQGLMGIYSDLRNGNTFGMAFCDDGMSDIAFGYYENFVRGTHTDRSGDVINRWQSLYDGVGRANTAIQNIVKTDLAADKKELYTAEAKFLRALYYFSLTDYFGDVPLYDETTILSESFASMKKPRTPIADVRAFILKDLAEAQAKLPVKWDDANYGRATKGAAYALAGKVNLYAKNYAASKAAFDEIVTDPSGKGYGYKLADDFAKLFTPEGDQGAEMVFAIQNQGGVGQNYGMAMCFRFGTRSTFGSCWSSVTPTVKLADMYERADGRPFNWNDFVPGFNEDNAVKDKAFRATLSAKGDKVTTYPSALAEIKKAYADRDPRLNQSLIVPYSEYMGWNANKEKLMTYVVAKGVKEGNGFIRLDQGKDSYLFRKFVPEGDMQGQIVDRSHTPINFPLIRYADVLLMLAEAENELGNQDVAIGYINQVRARKSTHMPALNSGPSFLAVSGKDQVLNRIMRERAVELAGEGHRFSDIRRWGKGVEWLNYDEVEFTGKYMHKHVFKDRDYLWPVPGTEIEKNASLAPNNPGW
ncbi:MAG: RagB/SusD family nutrient uptake outer membrane protein [Mucinivorans sp.]